MADNPVVALTQKGTFPAAVTNMNQAVYDAINQMAFVANAGMITGTLTLTNAQTKALFSAPQTLIAAQGAGTLIELLSMVVEYQYATAKMTAGGAIQASYDTGVTIPASATIAATFLTGPAANEVIKVSGALADNLSSAVLNKAVIFTCATQDFATGAGTLIVKYSYRVLSGL